MKDFSEQTLCILGSGLLGASLGLACHEKKLAKRIVAWSRSPQTRKETALQAWCDHVFESPEEAAKEADLVIICTPVSTIIPLFEQISASLSNSAIVTDVGSTKNNLLSSPALLQHPQKHQFIGAHPMAGSDKTGLAHAQANLFKNRTCIVTPCEHNRTEQVAHLLQFWEALEMTVFTTSAFEHDQAVASISHLPHAAAVALCNQLGDHYENTLPLSGAGFADSTRIAAGSADIWTDIFLENNEAVLQSFDDFEKALSELKEAIRQKDRVALTKLLEHAKQVRTSL